MSHPSQPSPVKLGQAVEVFWETFPPFWHEVRAYIRQVAVEQFDLNVEQFHILRHIRKGQGSVSEIAEAKHISRPAISQAVDVLVNKGLVRRTQNLQDRRHVSLDLTPEGNALLDAIFDQTRRRMEQMLALLSADELQALIGSMESLKKIISV